MCAVVYEEAPGRVFFLVDRGRDVRLLYDAGDDDTESGTKYEAMFTNAFGSTTTYPATLTVKAPATGPTVDARVRVTGANTATAALSTPTAGDLVVAFVAADGPSAAVRRRPSPGAV